MKISSAATAGAIGTLLALVSSGGTARAADQLSQFQGAWLQSLTCGDVFAPGAKGMGFKKPVNIFATAFIISGNILRTPQASCRISSVKPAGDRLLLQLGCANSISVTDVRTALSLSSDGFLTRYANEQDTVGSKYQRCSP